MCISLSHQSSGIFLLTISIGLGVQLDGVSKAVEQCVRQSSFGGQRVQRLVQLVEGQVEGRLPVGVQHVHPRPNRHQMGDRRQSRLTLAATHHRVLERRQARHALVVHRRRTLNQKF
ncbi:MAG: hypothetical protein GY820_30010 [Gammaproteobacteria bacterium]|nr:hypothetical protein [Gammaproteobacteria bacterium]